MEEALLAGSSRWPSHRAWRSSTRTSAVACSGVRRSAADSVNRGMTTSGGGFLRHRRSRFRAVIARVGKRGRAVGGWRIRPRCLRHTFGRCGRCLMVGARSRRILSATDRRGTPFSGSPWRGEGAGHHAISVSLASCSSDREPRHGIRRTLVLALPLGQGEECRSTTLPELSCSSWSMAWMLAANCRR